MEVICCNGEKSSQLITNTQRKSLLFDVFDDDLREVNSDRTDGLALPAFGPAGMENWGLIKYRESLLLLKEGITSESTRESITRLIAHEVGHQVRLISL